MSVGQLVDSVGMAWHKNGTTKRRADGGDVALPCCAADVGLAGALGGLCLRGLLDGRIRETETEAETERYCVEWKLALLMPVLVYFSCYHRPPCRRTFAALCF